MFPIKPGIIDAYMCHFLLCTCGPFPSCPEAITPLLLSVHLFLRLYISLLVLSILKDCTLRDNYLRVYASQF
eukprot:s2904_g6.t1